MAKEIQTYLEYLWILPWLKSYKIHITPVCIDLDKIKQNISPF